MEWLLKSVVPRLQRPKLVFKVKRAITGRGGTCGHGPAGTKCGAAEFYELLWHTGVSQTDAACRLAEDVDWNSRTIS